MRRSGAAVLLAGCVILAAWTSQATYIIVTAGIQTPTYAGWFYSITGSATYSAPAFPVKGANVSIALRGSNFTGHTINDGSYSIPVSPMPVGVYTAVVLVTDTSVWGTNRLAITVISDDQDGDGLVDSWEQQIVDADLLDAIDSVDDVLPTADFDGDGMDNRSEYWAMTQPTNNTRYFKVGDFTAPTNGPDLRWDSVTGRVYYLLSANDLMGSSWQTNLGPSAGSGGTMSYYVTNTDDADRYFRIRVQPP
jgi:hypothetical protein